MKRPRRLARLLTAAAVLVLGAGRVGVAGGTQTGTENAPRCGSPEHR
jgi:hypothetical protein